MVYMVYTCIWYICVYMVYYTIRRISSPLYCLFIFQYLFEISSFQRQTPENRFSNEHNIVLLSPALSLLIAHVRPDAERFVQFNIYTELRPNVKKGLRRVRSRGDGREETTVSGEEWGSIGINVGINIGTPSILASISSLVPCINVSACTQLLHERPSVTAPARNPSGTKKGRRRP